MTFRRYCDKQVVSKRISLMSGVFKTSGEVCYIEAIANRSETQPDMKKKK
jgi:hypothetical protein